MILRSAVKAMAGSKKNYNITDENGRILFEKYYVPEEVLSLILSYVPPKDLVFTCRSVCKYWCNVVDNQVWRILFRKVSMTVQVRELPWFVCYWIILKNPFGRNLVKNSCGQGIFIVLKCFLKSLNFKDFLMLLILLH